MIIRNFQNNFEVSDWTTELVTIPNQWGTIGQLGLFQEEGVEANVVQFEEITKDGGLLVDMVRGQRAAVGKDASRKVRSWPIPHFPYDEYISPSDIKGKRAYANEGAEETLAAVRARKLERVAQNHAWTLEYARAKLLTVGDVYAPNGTVVMNYFTEFGVSQTSVDMLFGTPTTQQIGKIEAGIAQIQDNMFGSNYNGYVGLCSPGFFAKLISHATVVNAYQYYTSTQEPLRTRLGGALTTRRTFEYGGVLWIEMRDNYAGNPLITAGEAVLIPTGSDIFKTYFAAANKFDLQGTLGERMYAFEYPGQKGDKIEIESESNFLNAVTRPACVVRMYSSN